MKWHKTSKKVVTHGTADEKDPRTVVGTEDKTRSFFRGTVPGETRRIDEPFEEAKGKTFVARRPESARLYGEQVEEFRPKPGARILFEGTPEFGKVTRRRKYDPELDIVNQLRKGETLISAVNAAILAAQQAGYDAVSFLRDSDIGTVLLNDSAFDRIPHVST